MKKIKLCHESSHDWHEVGKCKDAPGKHPCQYYSEGCDTCLSRFECYTKENDTYRSRISGLFYECTKCPAVRIEGSMSEWETHEIDNIIDSRKSHFFGMNDKLCVRLRDKWKDK